MNSRELQIPREKNLDFLSLWDFYLTGLVESEINCYDSLAIGIKAFKKISSLSFSEIKLSKEDEFKIRGKYTPVNI